jgi:hypothetical protein
VAYLLWLANMLVGAIAVIQVQAAADVVGAMRGASQYAINLANQLTLLLGGFAVFTYSVFLHSHYLESIRPLAQQETGSDAGLRPWLQRSGVGVLLRRFAITTAIPIVVLVLALVALEAALP